jgi:sulfur-oxidizing protein SoxA
MTVPVDRWRRPFYDARRSIFETCMGQLRVSCMQCGEALAGPRAAGALIPQGQSYFYAPCWLEWQSRGSFQRRIRNA